MKSTSGSLNLRDWLKGLIMAIGTPVVLLLQQLIPSWTPWLVAHFGQNGGMLMQAAISAFIAYIVKQFITDTNAAAVTTLTTAATVIGEPIVIQPAAPASAPLVSNAPNDSTAAQQSVTKTS